MKFANQDIEEGTSLRTSINFLLNPSEEESHLPPSPSITRIPCSHTSIIIQQTGVTQPKISNLVDCTSRLTLEAHPIPHDAPSSDHKIQPSLFFLSPSHQRANGEAKLSHMEIKKDPKIAHLEAECAKISQLDIHGQPKITQSEPMVTSRDNSQSASPDFHLSIIKSNKKKQMKMMVIREKHLLMRQTEAAYQLGFSSSTFSKRWRDSVPTRKWPYRKNSKLSNAIKVLRSMQKKSNQDHFDSSKSHVENELARLLKERNDNLRPAVIHYYEKDMTKGKKMDESTL